MPYKLHKEMNIAHEISDLYYVIINKKKLDEVPSRLPEYGIDEEAFKRVELKPIYKYIETFEKKMKYQDKEELRFYFEEISEELRSESLAHLIIDGRNLEELKLFKEEIEGMKEEVLKAEVAQNIAASLEDALETDKWEAFMCNDTAIAYLQEKAITLQAKWNMILLFGDIKKYTLRLIKIILESEKAYDLASKHVVKLKEWCISNLKEEVMQNPQYFNHLCGVNIDEEYNIILYPSIACWGTVSISIGRARQTAYLGCYVAYVTEMVDKNNTDKLEMVAILKLFGEASKYEILGLLKERPRYGLEIAEHLNITTATVSHHMNNLMIYRMVTIEKKEGKVFYTLNKKKVEEVIGNLRKYLIED